MPRRYTTNSGSGLGIANINRRRQPPVLIRVAA